MKDRRKKGIFITVQRPGRAIKTLLAGKGVTIGSNLKSDIAVEDLKLPKCYNLIQKRGENYILRLIKGTEGILYKGNHSISIETLINMGLLKEEKGFYALEFDVGSSGEIRFPTAIIKFDYKEWTESRLPLEWPLMSKRDSQFSIILLLSLFIHIVFVYYLNTIEIKKLSSLDTLKSMSPRFARLILNPSKTRPKNVSREVKKEEIETKKEETVEKKQETVKEAKKIETASEETKKLIREKVKTAGILGVITAAGGIMAELERGDVWKDMDAIIAQNVKAGAEGDAGNTEVADTASLSEELLKTVKGVRTAEEIIKEKKEKVSFGREGSEKRKAVQRREEDVYRIVRSYSGGLKYLYNNALLKNPRLKGAVTVKIIITADGTVSNAEILNSTLKDNDLKEAILKRIYRWRFDELKNAEEYTIDYTFDFAPVG